MEMRERIARALTHYALEQNGHVYIGDQLEFYVGQTWKNHLHQADAVLAAMREPDEAMKRAGRMRPTVGSEYRAGKAWSRMIDAARSTPTTPNA